LASANEGIWAGLPTINARSTGATGDGASDDTAALQASLDKLESGGTLVLDGGVFVQSACLHLRHANLRIVGRGARLHASNPDDMCVSLEGERSELRDLELTARTEKRGTQLAQSRVVVTGRGTKVVGNRITGSASAAIMIFGASDYAIVGNRIQRTLSDGIHSTHGATRGYVAGNVTDATGDDGIAVVSYRDDGLCSRIVIEDNKVQAVSWARGISVVGGARVVVRRNTVAGTGRAAGIIITREESYNTHGVDRVLVLDNSVSQVAKLFQWKDDDQTGQATVDVNSYAPPTPDLQVRRVLIAGNKLSDGRTDGIRLLGGVCDATIIGNSVQRMGGAAITVVDPACARPLAACIENEVGAGLASHPECRSR
jgi:polygalacturonase